MEKKKILFDCASIFVGHTKSSCTQAGVCYATKITTNQKWEREANSINQFV